MQKTLAFSQQDGPTDHHKNDCYGIGPVVYTHKRRVSTLATHPLANDEFGVSMNQDASTGGTPLGIHNGLDSALWTASDIIGTKMTASSGDRANTGSFSVKVDNPALNNVWQFDRGSDLTLSGYVSITMYVNIDKDWSTGDSVSIYGWDTASGLVVGVPVLLENYLAEFSFDVWQKVTVPLSDMGLAAETIDAIRMSLVRKGGGKAPKFYLDDMQFEQTGNNIAFEYAPSHSEIFHVEKVALTFLDTYTGAIEYSQFLGVASLPSGLLLEVVSDGQTIIATPLRNTFDILQFPQAQPLEVHAGATQTMMKATVDSIVTLDGGKGDSLSVTVQDDLSGLDDLRVWVFGSVEVK